MLCLLSLFAPLAAGARPPQSAGLLAPLPSFSALRPSIAGPHLLVTRLSSAPAHARAGHDYVLRGMVVNEGSAAVRGRVVVHLLHVGTRPLAVGRTAVSLAAHDSSSFRVRVRLPRFLHDGSYAVVACARRGGQSGALGCVTAERHLADRDGGSRGRAFAARLPPRASLLVGRSLAVAASVRTSIRRPATAATRACTPTSSDLRHRRRTCSCRERTSS